MPKTVSASEAKNRLGALMQWAVRNRDEVVVESRGRPAVVIMPYTAYETVIELRDRQRRKDALAQLEALASQVRARNQDLSEQAALDLADRFTQEVVEELVAEGQVQYAAP